MIVERTIRLPCSPEECWKNVKTPRLLEYVSWPIVRFRPIEPSQFSEEWEEKRYVVGVWLFGLIPIGRQQINITGRKLSAEAGSFLAELRDNGSGSLVTKWDHRITIRQDKDGCLYTDKVQIKAGLLTPVVGIFAWFFYRHQRRWLRLATSNFAA